MSGATIYRSTVWRWHFWEGLSLVEDRNGNKLTLTKGGSLAVAVAFFAIITGSITLVGTGFAVIHYMSGYRQEIYDQGVSAEKAAELAAKEASDRHDETERFRAYQRDNDDERKALEDRISAMEEAQLKAAGVPVPPPAQTVHRIKPNGTAWVHHLSPDGSCCMQAGCKPGTPDCTTDLKFVQ